MRLAVLDAHDNIILSWPSTRDAHADLGALLAAKVHPRFWQSRKRRKLAERLVEHIVELQRETVSL